MRAAMFREEWLDKAKQLLPNSADRALFYEALMCKAFEREIPVMNNPVVAAMFIMAESAISADLEKYAARCERNRENALKRISASGNQSQRVVASGSESLPSQPNTSTSTSSSTNTSTNTSTSSISCETMTDEREIYLIYYTLFKRGALDMQSEFDAFYNYYAALGWKNNKGAPIVSKVSAAAMWRLSGDTCANIAQRQAWADAFKNAPTTSVLVWTAFRDLQVKESDTERCLYISLALNSQQIEAMEDKCERCFRGLMSAYNCQSIEYRCTRN